jgi:L-fuconate dehydratase
MIIRDMEVLDLRFPTSRTQDGTDAMHPDPDYSAAYVVLKTDTGIDGHGLTFTIGRGNDICAMAIQSFRHLVVGQSLEAITADMGGFWRRLAGESQLRWLGPEKGVIHISMAAIINAVWDLWGKAEKKPVWKLLADMTPKQIVACIDFRHITDALTPDEAIAILERGQAGKAEREAQLLKTGYPAYTTSVGWMGYSDEKIRRLCKEALAAGFTHFKVKVGGSPQDDARRVGVVREEIGPDRFLMTDANQRWEIAEAIERMTALARFKPHWIEEPLSPDDVLGHAAVRKALQPLGIKVATGEHGMNRVLFKQLLQAQAIDFCQIDSCRVGGVNENLAIILMAAKFGVPVCPHAGGVGLCEYVQHLSMWDYLSVTGSTEGRVIEFVDHLHEHFLDPVVIRNGRYMPPQRPGYSIEMTPESRVTYSYPGGTFWVEDLRPKG